MTSALKCTRCTHEILDGDHVAYRHGNWFHMRRWRVLTTSEQIRESHRLAAQSHQQVVAVKNTGPDGVMIDVSETGWLR